MVQGVKNDPTKWPVEKQKLFKKMFNRNVSSKVIAKEFKCSVYLVYSLADRLGLSRKHLNSLWVDNVSPMPDLIYPIKVTIAEVFDWLGGVESGSRAGMVKINGGDDVTIGRAVAMANDKRCRKGLSLFDVKIDGDASGVSIALNYSRRPLDRCPLA